MSSPHVFFWHQVDETMANMMLAQASQEIRVLIHEDEQQIYFQNIGNGNSVTIPSQRLEMQRLRSDEWAGRIYELYCETWQCQQKPLSPQFLRAVCQHGIRTLISARIGSVTSELDNEQRRTGQHSSEWLKSVKISFNREMELLFHKWFQAAEIDAKTMEHMLAATPDNPVIDSVATELISTRTRVRIFDARTASAHAKILALERALSTAQVHELAAHRPKLMAQILERLNSDKSDFQSRREEWQARLNAALSRLPELRNIPDHGATTKAQKLLAKSKPDPNPEYRSEMKRAIRMLLTISGDTTDLQICRLFDKDGIVDLPEGWKTGDNRSFEIAYKHPQHRPKIEKMISKVRTDLRSIGILK
jgi:hypothetical protein